MALVLGIDTGGTFTDAIVLDRSEPTAGGEVIATAKAPTTHDDLAVGIAAAVDAVVRQDHVTVERIAMVSLSTTLATNALAEGRLDEVGLVLIGFDDEAYRRSGIARFSDGSTSVVVTGGHNSAGMEVAPLARDELAERVRALNERVEAYAVVGLFSVRNPSHEDAAREFIMAETGRPVTCSHELSAALHGPRRALTTYLNAGLIPQVRHLLDASVGALQAAGIACPVMVVRGDGSLTALDTAYRYPVETILSGPAASVIGAKFLAGVDDAIVSDIGGTTTDVAVLTQGEVRVDARGAKVGDRRTFVRAVDVHTFALGGDSEVGLEEYGESAQLTLGPRRAIPISRFAETHGSLVRQTLERQLNAPAADELSGCFAVVMRHGARAGHGLPELSQEVLRLLDDGPMAVDEVARSRRRLGALGQLRRQGWVNFAALTPTDAMLVLGEGTGGDRPAAVAAAELFARRRNRLGRAAAADGTELASAIADRVRRLSAEAILETAFSHDGYAGAELARSSLVDASLTDHRGIFSAAVRLAYPVVAVGAAAGAYYMGVGQALAAEVRIPSCAEVANAVGAAVGPVIAAVELTILQPTAKVFVLHGMGEPQRFTSVEAAITAAESAGRKQATAQADSAGAEAINVTVERTERSADVEGERMLVELKLRVVARGVPRASLL